MDLIIWIIIGGITGGAISLLTSYGRDQEVVADITIGVVGALIGGYATHVIGGINSGGINIVNVIVVIVGALSLLAIVKLFSRTTS